MVRIWQRTWYATNRSAVLDAILRVPLFTAWSRWSIAPLCFNCPLFKACNWTFCYLFVNTLCSCRSRMSRTLWEINFRRWISHPTKPKPSNVSFGLMCHFYLCCRCSFLLAYWTLQVYPWLCSSTFTPTAPVLSMHAGYVCTPFNSATLQQSTRICWQHMPPPWYFCAVIYMPTLLVFLSCSHGWWLIKWQLEAKPDRRSSCLAGDSILFGRRQLLPTPVTAFLTQMRLSSLGNLRSGLSYIPEICIPPDSLHTSTVATLLDAVSSNSLAGTL